MNDTKFIGLDIYQTTISAAVLDSNGKLGMEVVLETRAATLLQFIHGLRGSLRVTFEEGTCAAWLHDLLKSQVTEVLVIWDAPASIPLAGRLLISPGFVSSADRPETSTSRRAFAGGLL